MQRQRTEIHRNRDLRSAVIMTIVGENDRRTEFNPRIKQETPMSLANPMSMDITPAFSSNTMYNTQLNSSIDRQGLTPTRCSSAENVFQSTIKSELPSPVNDLIEQYSYLSATNTYNHPAQRQLWNDVPAINASCQYADENVKTGRNTLKRKFEDSQQHESRYVDYPYMPRVERLTTEMLQASEYIDNLLDLKREYDNMGLPADVPFTNATKIARNIRQQRTHSQHQHATLRHHLQMSTHNYTTF